MRDGDDDAAAALSAFPGFAGAVVEPLGQGLINHTYRVVAGGGAAHVLQRVNPMFDPRIHDNLVAVTERLAARGMATPRLLLAAGGRPFVDLGEGGLWRLMTLIEGHSFDRVASPSQARSAGALVGRFHGALDGLAHRFVGLRQGVHDTERHLAALAAAIERHREHRLHAEVSELGRAILARAAELTPLPELPLRPGHGDLKFNNLRFAGAEPPSSERAVALIDLDTVGPQSLAFELGDAWRSWCNPEGEDAAVASFSLEVFAASLEGYRDGAGRELTGEERRALLLGLEWVSLELAARFAADALAESYFGWDPGRFPGRGEHNWLRARGQWSLHQAACALRGERARLLGVSV